MPGQTPPRRPGLAKRRSGRGMHTQGAYRGIRHGTQFHTTGDPCPITMPVRCSKQACAVSVPQGEPSNARMPLPCYYPRRPTVTPWNAFSVHLFAAGSPGCAASAATPRLWTWNVCGVRTVHSSHRRCHVLRHKRCVHPLAGVCCPRPLFRGSDLVICHMRRWYTWQDRPAHQLSYPAIGRGALSW